MTRPSQYGALEKLIGQGPVTVILVFSPSCPHCHTYMPIWKELQKTPNKQANMVTMEASVFDQTPLSEKKQIEGVPSVLKVGPDGTITEVSDIRNTTNMKNILQNRSSSPTTEAMNPEDLVELTETLSPSPKRETSAPLVVPNVPGVTGVTVEENPLPVIPGETSSEASALRQFGGRQQSRRRRGRRVTQRGGNNLSHQQVGGNPWAAFLASAGPVAVLAGAYAALPARSSGLPAPQHSAKWRSIRARLTRRHRRR